jgi:hypothetical protein
MKGYCWLHDKEYKVIQGDEVCPQCLNNKEQDLKWRATEDRLTTDEMETYER